MKGRAEHNAAAIAASRLPDPPNAGYATKTEKLLSDIMQELCRGIERDRIQLLDIVINGHLKWRKVFKKACRFIKADDELADAVFRYFVMLAGPNPHAQIETLIQMQRQQAQQRWDYRRSTAKLFEKARRELRLDIHKDGESRRKKKVYLS